MKVKIILECVFGWLLTDKINSNKTEFSENTKKYTNPQVPTKSKSRNFGLNNNTCVFIHLCMCEFFSGGTQEVTLQWSQENVNVKTRKKTTCVSLCPEMNVQCEQRKLGEGGSVLRRVWRWMRQQWWFECCGLSLTLYLCSYLAYFHYCLCHKMP